MMVKKTLLGLWALAAVWLVALPAHAQDIHGFYGGGTAMWNLFSENGDLDDVDLDDDDDFGWDVLAGYQISEYVGVEGGWRNLGAAEGRDTTPEDVPVDVEVEAEGAFAQVNGSYPLLDGRLWLMATGGALFYDFNVDTSTTSTLHESDTGVAFVAGAGVQVPVVKHISLRLGYKHYFELSDIEVDSFGLSVIFHQWD